MSARGTFGGGLCPDCRNVRVVATPSGSRFLLCRLAKTDERFPKYPPQPVVACPGFERYGSAPDEPGDPARGR